MELFNKLIKILQITKVTQNDLQVLMEKMNEAQREIGEFFGRNIKKFAKSNPY